MISCLYRSVVPRGRQLGKANASITRRAGILWENSSDELGCEHLAVSHSEDQFETGLLKIEYANSALDLLSITDRLG